MNSKSARNTSIKRKYKMKDLHRDAILSANGLVVNARLVASKAKVIQVADKSVPAHIRLIAWILSGAGNPRRKSLYYQIVLWPNGLIGVLREKVIGKARIQALAKAYQESYDELYKAVERNCF